MNGPMIRTAALGKRYGGRWSKRWALADCTLEIPAAVVCGLVGPNGAGKSTLLNLAAGLLRPTTGTIEVCGAVPGRGTAQLAKVGFVAQDTPVYPSLSVRDHLALGARLNPGWDDGLAQARLRALGLDPAQRAGRLSGGQRAQLALMLGLAKRPEVLILDEPVASLDPLARRDFLQVLMAAVAEDGVSVVLSSHVVSDLERVCDHVVVLTQAQVRLTGAVEDLVATHVRLTGPRRDASLPSGQQVIRASHTDRQTTVVVRTEGPILDPSWTVAPLGLEDIVLLYMEESDPADPSARTDLAVIR